MTPENYGAALALLDKMMQEFYQAYRGRREARIRDQLAELNALADDDQTPFIRIQLGLADRHRQNPIRLGWIDVSHMKNGELFVLGHDTTPRSYQIDGKVVCLSETQCPICLGEWQVDARHLDPCHECGCRLGVDARIISMQGECPFCHEQRVADAGFCGCGFDWNADYVVQ